MVVVSKWKRNERTSIGFLLKQWDNQLDNTVGAFEEMFKTSLNYDSKLEVEIGDLFTTDGRYLLIGDDKVSHMFKEDCYTNYNNHIVYDTYELNGTFIDRYKSFKDLVAFYEVSDTTIVNIIKGNAPNNRLRIRINKIDLGEENGTVN